MKRGRQRSLLSVDPRRGAEANKGPVPFPLSFFPIIKTSQVENHQHATQQQHSTIRWLRPEIIRQPPQLTAARSAKFARASRSRRGFAQFLLLHPQNCPRNYIRRRKIPFSLSVRFARINELLMSGFAPANTPESQPTIPIATWFTYKSVNKQLYTVTLMTCARIQCNHEL